MHKLVMIGLFPALVFASWIGASGAAPEICASPGERSRGPAILKFDALRDYVDSFTDTDHTHFGQAISNEAAADWMADNVPLFECPDKDMEEIYHFRWWTFRKHIKKTPDGFVITEFLPKVGWSGKHNTIGCPAGHHFREGRWIGDKKYLDDDAKFFKVLPRGEQAVKVDVRELHGYTPWYFNLPEKGRGYEVAWKQLMDSKGFHAHYGPTVAEQRHPRFAVSYSGHECQWNGPSWPFATAVTLTALANVLNDYPQQAVSSRDYFETLEIYTKSHRLKREDGTVVPWIGENLNPHDGDWIARTRLKTWKNGNWDQAKGGVERGKDYNHSTYCDLIITGLVGLRPRANDTVEVHPLLPAGTWEYFCLDGVPYHGRMLTILFDKTGKKYGRGIGLRILADGREIGASTTLGRLTAPLPPHGG